MQDRPTVAELIQAVREFLEQEAGPLLQGRAAYQAKVARNVLSIVERELIQGAALDAAERASLARLIGRDGELKELNRMLAAAIRHGRLDRRRPELMAHLRQTVLAKLAIDNPRYPVDRPAESGKGR